MLAFLLFIYFYRETLLALVRIWSDWTNENYSHGFLILGVSVFLIWRQRERLTNSGFKPDFLALAPAVFFSLVWFVSLVGGVQMINVTVPAFLLFSLSWLVFGRAAAKTLLMPIGYLLFAMPVWEPLIPILQHTTAVVTYRVLTVLNVSSLLEGNNIYIPEGIFIVEESCSGIRYLNASLALGVLYAFLNYRSRIKQALCMLAAFIVPVLANWLRVSIVVYLGHASNMQNTLVHNHINFGWYLYGGIILPLCWLGMRYADSVTPGYSRISPQRRSAADWHPGYPWFAAAIAAALSISSGPLLYQWVDYRTGKLPEIIMSVVPASAPFTGPVESSDSWRPRYTGASRDITRVYQFGDARIFLYSACYRGLQVQGNEMINTLNSVVGDDYWRKVTSGMADVRINDNPVKVIETLMESPDGRKRIIWHWYHVAGHDLTNRYMVKLLEAFDILVEQAGSSVIALSTDYQTEPDEGRSSLLRFLSRHGTHLVTIREIN